MLVRESAWDAFFDGSGGNRGVYIRFRVIDGTGNPDDCAARTTAPENNYVLLPGGASGYACSGEVEDYFLNFTPTAVEMQNFEAVQSNTGQLVFIITLISLLAATAIAFIGYRRTREL